MPRDRWSFRSFGPLVLGVGGLRLDPLADVGLPCGPYAEVLRELLGGGELEGLPRTLAGHEVHLHQPVDVVVRTGSAGLHELGLEDGLIVRYGAQRPHETAGQLRLPELPGEVRVLGTEHHPELVPDLGYHDRRIAVVVIAAKVQDRGADLVLRHPDALRYVRDLQVLRAGEQRGLDGGLGIQIGSPPRGSSHRDYPPASRRSTQS